MSEHQQNQKNTRGIQVWFCPDCSQVHLRATNVALDFTKQEFLGLSDAILRILRYQFTPEDLKSIPSLKTDTDDVLFADTIV